MSNIYYKDLLKKFVQSVNDLADKLPQWNCAETCPDRFITAFVSSVLEESGEVAGLISKYMTRKTKGVDTWDTEFSDMSKEMQDTIKEKIISETGDLLWVITAGVHGYPYKNPNDGLSVADVLIGKMKTTEEEDKKITHHLSTGNPKMFAISCILNIADIADSLFFMFNRTDIQKKNCGTQYFTDMLKYYSIWLSLIKRVYGISLEDVLKHNMEKLGIRYDTATGERVDGKL